MKFKKKVVIHYAAGTVSGDVYTARKLTFQSMSLLKRLSPMEDSSFWNFDIVVAHHATQDVLKDRGFDGILGLGFPENSVAKMSFLSELRRQGLLCPRMPLTIYAIKRAFDAVSVTGTTRYLETLTIGSYSGSMYLKEQGKYYEVQETAGGNQEWKIDLASVLPSARTAESVILDTGTLGANIPKTHMEHICGQLGIDQGDCVADNNGFVKGCFLPKLNMTDTICLLGEDHCDGFNSVAVATIAGGDECGLLNFRGVDDSTWVLGLAYWSTFAVVFDMEGHNCPQFRNQPCVGITDVAALEEKNCAAVPPYNWIRTDGCGNLIEGLTCTARCTNEGWTQKSTQLTCTGGKTTGDWPQCGRCDDTPHHPAWLKLSGCEVPMPGGQTCKFSCDRSRGDMVTTKANLVYSVTCSDGRFLEPVPTCGLLDYTVISWSSAQSDLEPTTEAMQTVGENNGYWNTYPASSGWLILDLGRIAPVRGMRTKNTGGCPGCNAKDCSLQTGPGQDGPWETVYSFESKQTVEWQEFTIPSGPVETRYIRWDIERNWGDVYTEVNLIDAIEVF